MFGIGTWELVIILVLALVILGPAKLPEVAKTLGKGLASIRKSAEEVKREIDIDGIRRGIEEDVGLDELKRIVDVREDIHKVLDQPTESEMPPSEILKEKPDNIESTEMLSSENQQEEPDKIKPPEDIKS